MDNQHFYSSILVDLKTIPVEEQKWITSSNSSYLMQDVWKWIQIIQRDEEWIVSAMVLEDGITITSARERFATLKSYLLPLSGLIDADKEVGDIISVKGNLNFDQWILVVFAGIASGKRVAFADQDIMSMRNRLVNQWMEELPFIGNYIANENAGIVKAIERSYVVLVDEYSDLDGVVEFILRYHVLQRSTLPIKELTIVTSNLIQLQLNTRWKSALGSLIQGELNDLNADYNQNIEELLFTEELPQGAIVLDWTKGQSSLPRFEYKDLLNWINA